MCAATRRRQLLPHKLALVAAVFTVLTGVSTASAACLRGGPDLSALSKAETRAVASGSLLELTNATLAARLEAAASAQRYILYTTTSAWQPESINMTVNWFAHIQRCADFSGTDSRARKFAEVASVSTGRCKTMHSFKVCRCHRELIAAIGQVPAGMAACACDSVTH